MKKFYWFFLLVVAILSLSLPDYVHAKDTREKEFELDEGKNHASNCEFLYILREDSIDKHSLPSLSLVLSADLPIRTKGESINIAGECGDPQETILVSVKRKGRDGGEAILSYNKDLQLIGELSFLEDDDEDDNDDDEDDNDDDEDDKD